MSEPSSVWTSSIVPHGLESVPSSFEQLTFGDGLVVDNERVTIQCMIEMPASEVARLKAV
jgi:hypothetical protein